MRWLGTRPCCVKGGGTMKLGSSAIASALVSAGLLVTACGTSSPPGTKTAAQVIPAMEAAMEAASSVHISGAVTENSQTVSIDAGINGSGFSGNVAEGGLSYTLIAADGNVYVKVTQALLKSGGLPAADCSIVCGKYLQVPAANVAKFTTFISMSRLMSRFVKSIPSAAGDTSDLFKPATFENQPVLQLRQSFETADVARTGPAYPLFLSYSAGGKRGSLTFSEWNSVPPVTPPAPGQLVTAGSL
jgi:hypothetical protein